MSADTLSTSHAAFYPVSLTPPFADACPPTKLDTFWHDGTGMNYFQRCRNDRLSKFSMPRYEWGMQRIPYSPEAEMVAAAKRRNINRDLILPSNHISTLDVLRIREVDNFYKVVQIHRSQYKDRSGTAHPLTYFKPDYHGYQCADGMTKSYIRKYQENYVAYKTPIILPLTYRRRKEIPRTPDFSLSGIYDKTSCIAYKR